MGQIRHGSASTTHAIRAHIQRSQASIAELSRELGINPKTVAKWRKRQSVEDQKTGPKEPRSTVLSEEEEYPSGLAALDVYFGVQLHGASSLMRLIL